MPGSVIQTANAAVTAFLGGLPVLGGETFSKTMQQVFAQPMEVLTVSKKSTAKNGGGTRALTSEGWSGKASWRR